MLNHELRNNNKINLNVIILSDVFDEKEFDLFIKKKTAKLPDVFRNMGVLLDVENIKKNEQFKSILGSVVDISRKNKLIPLGVIHCLNVDKDFIAEELKLPVLSGKLFNSSATEVKVEKEIVEVEKIVEVVKIVEVEKIVEVQSKERKLIKHFGTVRGGQQLYAKNADLLIVGDVKVNAEIIADGDIFVVGKMEGKAMAGADGDLTAKILIEKSKATSLSIGEYSKIYEDEQDDYIERIVIVLDNKNQVVIKNY